MPKDYSFEDIARYLEGQMEKDEIQDFEKTLDEDNSLKMAVASQQETHLAVELYSRSVIKDKVKSIHNQIKSQEIQSSRPGFSVMRIAATVSILLMVGLGYFYVSQNYNSNQLADNAFELYPNRFNNMGERAEGAFNRGLTAYDNKNYDEAISQFKLVEDQNTQFLDAQFYLGVSYLGSDNFSMASTQFEYILARESMYVESAEWYLSLCYLQLDEVEKAKSILQTVVDSGGARATTAQELLDQLNSPLRKLPFIN